jgi:zinc transport system substrate-binding protein
MTSARALIAGTTVLALSALAACGDTAESGDGGSEIAAAFYPLAWTAERVAGDHHTVRNLTSPGGEPHDLELSIRQTATLTGADLVLHLHGFQPAVDAAVEENAGGAVLDAADVVDLMAVSDHGHGDGASDDGHGHAEGEADPHFWLDPARMADLGDAVAAELSGLHPDRADDYTAEADALREDLEQLDAEYAEGLAGCARDAVVVSHDAFGYLEKYGLHVEPVLGLSPDAEPTAATLARLRDLIRAEGVTTVFAETLASPRTAESLARDAGVDTAVLDPIEGLTAETADEDYLSLMRANLAALQEANGC